MKRRIPLPWIFAAAGGLLFSLALYRANLGAREPSETRALARLQPVFGTTFVERNEKKDSAKAHQILQKLDTVETSHDSEALIQFPNGEQVRLFENSVALLDLEAGKALLILKEGDLWVETAKDGADAVMISRDGIRRSLAGDRDYQSHERAVEKNRLVTKVKTPLREKASAPANSGDIAFPPRSRLESLTSDYIQSTLRTQRNLFFKCYTSLLQKTPGVSGEASVAFTIERSGRVSQAEVSSSNFKDPNFRRCLTEAVRRVEFKSFAGDPVNTLFPLRFQ